MDLRRALLYIYISGNQCGEKGPFLRGWVSFLVLEQPRKRNDGTTSPSRSTHAQEILAVMQDGLSA